MGVVERRPSIDMLASSGSKAAKSRQVAEGVSVGTDKQRNFTSRIGGRGANRPNATFLAAAGGLAHRPRPRAASHPDEFALARCCGPVGHAVPCLFRLRLSPAAR